MPTFEEKRILNAFASIEFSRFEIKSEMTAFELMNENEIPWRHFLLCGSQRTCHKIKTDLNAHTN